MGCLPKASWMLPLILNEGGLPFDLKLPMDTISAIKDAEESKNLVSVKSSDELFNDLGI